MKNNYIEIFEKKLENIEKIINLPKYIIEHSINFLESLKNSAKKQVLKNKID
jgi:hypothetical protein